MFKKAEKQVISKILNSMKNLENSCKNDKILVFAPHPDDETIGAGGFIYESIKNGAEVTIVLVTDGNRHRLKEKRYAEFLEATEILRVKSENIIFLNFPDGGLVKEDTEKVKEEFLKIIENLNPDIVVYPSPSDQHSDHSVTGTIVEQILDEKGKRGIKYLVHFGRFPYPGKFNPEGYILPPKSVKYGRDWRKLMLSEEACFYKRQAIEKYQTQLRFLPLRKLIHGFVRKNEIFNVD